MTFHSLFRLVFLSCKFQISWILYNKTADVLTVLKESILVIQKHSSTTRRSLKSDSSDELANTYRVYIFRQQTKDKVLPRANGPIVSSGTVYLTNKKA